MEEDRVTLEIIEKCLQEDIDVDFLQSKAQRLNVDQFSEIAEELSVNKRCGYVLCKNVLSPVEYAKSQQKFKIRYNRIFNVSQRRLFCSDECFGLFNGAKNQFEDAPNPKKLINFGFPQNKKENTDQIGEGDLKSGHPLGEEIELGFAANIVKAFKDLTILDHFEEASTQEEPNPDLTSSNKTCPIEPSDPLKTEINTQQETKSCDQKESSRDQDLDLDDFDWSPKESPSAKKTGSPHKKQHSNPEEALNEIRKKYFEQSKTGLKLKKPAVKMTDPLPLKSVNKEHV